MTRTPPWPLAPLALALLTACATPSPATAPADALPPAGAADPAVAAEDAVWTAPRALQLCQGSPQAASPMTNLRIDHALMDKANPLADFSRQTAAVESMEGWFPAVEAEGHRPLMVTPVVTSAEGALERIAVVVTERGDEIADKGELGTLRLLVLGCAREGGYQALAPPIDLIDGQALQFRGADVIPVGGGRFVTGINLMLSSPSIGEFGVFSWLIGPEGADPAKAASWGAVDAFGRQVVAGMSGEYARTDPFTGTGWFPLDGSSTWALIVLMGASHPGEDEGSWEERTTVQPIARLSPEGLAPSSVDGVWLWAGQGARPEGCGATIRCASLGADQGGDFPWNGPPPFDWLVGAWTSFEAAREALAAAGVDFKRGFFLVDSAAEEIRQEEGASLPWEAPVRDALPYRAEEAP